MIIIYTVRRTYTREMAIKKKKITYATLISTWPTDTYIRVVCGVYAMHSECFKRERREGNKMKKKERGQEGKKGHRRCYIGERIKGYTRTTLGSTL